MYGLNDGEAKSALLLVDGKQFIGVLRDIIHQSRENENKQT